MYENNLYTYAEKDRENLDIRGALNSIYSM